MTKQGSPKIPTFVLQSPKKIVERAADFGIPARDIVVDPLVMPIGAIESAGKQVFQLIARLQQELGVNTTCGASNISFGLPNRKGIDGHFLSMAMAAGLTAAITNPLHDEVKQAVRAGNVLMGHDSGCMRWIAKYADRAEGGRTPRGRRRGRISRQEAGSARD